MIAKIRRVLHKHLQAELETILSKYAAKRVARKVSEDVAAQVLQLLAKRPTVPADFKERQGNNAHGDDARG